MLRFGVNLTVCGTGLSTLFVSSINIDEEVVIE
jgi:hypothetical protein